MFFWFLFPAFFFFFFPDEIFAPRTNIAILLATETLLNF